MLCFSEFSLDWAILVVDSSKVATSPNRLFLLLRRCICWPRSSQVKIPFLVRHAEEEIFSLRAMKQRYIENNSSQLIICKSENLRPFSCTLLHDDHAISFWITDQNRKLPAGRRCSTTLRQHVRL